MYCPFIYITIIITAGSTPDGGSAPLQGPTTYTSPYLRVTALLKTAASRLSPRRGPGEKPRSASASVLFLEGRGAANSTSLRSAREDAGYPAFWQDPTLPLGSRWRLCSPLAEVSPCTTGGAPPCNKQ